MTFTQIRIIKWMLLALFLVCTGYVVHHLREGMRSPTVDALDIPDEPENITSRQVELEQLDSEGNTAWTLTAAESVGQTESGQQFRDAEIHFNAGADDTPVVVTADLCNVRRDSSVHLQGNVVVRDNTSLRLEAESLEFRRFPDRVWSSEPVRYFKDDIVGDAGSMSYVIKRGELDLDDGVDMILNPSSDAPIHITSKSAFMNKTRHRVQYVDTVFVRQKSKSLTCNDLQVFLNDDHSGIERIHAFDNVVLNMEVSEKEADEDDSEKSGAFTSEAGTKRLSAERLEMIFGPSGEELERVRALDGGRLELRLPDNATKGYHKELSGHTLAFDFDERGELTKLRGRGGVTLVLFPVSGDGGERKIVRARRIESDFDPVTGDLVEARCTRAVEFEQGDVRATAEEGIFRAANSKLILRKSPRLWDPRASLEARRIVVDIDTGNVEGIRDVRSSSAGEEGGAGLFPSSAKDPVYFVADHLVYDRSRELAVYTGGARGFQGRSRVEADTIQIFEKMGDLLADGNVRTVLLQELVRSDAVEGGGADKPVEPTVTKAASLHYRAADEVLEYQDGVEMRSSEMTLHGDRVEVRLAKGGSGVEEVYAEGEVEIITADGKAAGERARYLPDEQSMTLGGEHAWLENGGKLTEGKQLTFFLSNDKILVDGQEQNRTKTTYSSKTRPF